MMEPVRKLIGGNLDISLMPLKEGRAVTVVKDLTAEAQSFEEEGPSVEFVQTHR